MCEIHAVGPEPWVLSPGRAWVMHDCAVSRALLFESVCRSHVVPRTALRNFRPESHAAERWTVCMCKFFNFHSCYRKGQICQFAPAGCGQIRKFAGAGRCTRAAGRWTTLWRWSLPLNAEKYFSTPVATFYAGVCFIDCSNSSHLYSPLLSSCV